MINETSSPKDFEEPVKLLKLSHKWTVQTVESLFRLIKICTKKSIEQYKVDESNELGNMAKTCDKLKNHFPDCEYFELLDKVSIVCTIMEKREALTQIQMFERAVMPIKVWADEEYYNILNDINQCTISHSTMLKAKKLETLKPNALTKDKSNEASTAYQNQYILCRSKLVGLKKVFRHHKSCIQLIVEAQYKNSKFASEEIDKLLKKTK